MDPEDAGRIRQAYQESRGDALPLFQTVLAVAEKTGLAEALACLEACVTEKRLAWLERNPQAIQHSGDPVEDGYRLFYEGYLGLSMPKDGELVESAAGRMVTRWWNLCPTLEACQKLGLDTREICRQVYERPVERMLQRVDPRLRFRRNYASLRPQQPYCEEIIALEETASPSSGKELAP